MKIIGHQKQRQVLKKAIKDKNFSHAYLFAGQEKLGKKTLALELISFLFRETSRSHDGSVDSKKSVQQTNLSLNNHPDLIFIKPETREIKISQIRSLISKTSLKPSLASVKTALIDDAHLMNQEAQTSFLKTLEEPKGETFLILISHNPQYLLPTILSRLQIIKFNPVEKKEIKKYLLNQGFSEKKAEKISEISLGRPGRALDLISDGEKLKDFEKKMEEINEISKKPLYFRFQYVKNLADNPEEINNSLDVWLYYYRNILLEHPTKKIIKIINLIEEIKILISKTNINKKLALERLALEL